MADGDAQAHAPPAPIAWALIALGIALGAACVMLGPKAAAGVPLQSELGMEAVFFLAIFLPLMLIGLMFARLDGFPALRLGASPARWAATGLLTGCLGVGMTAGYAALAGSLARGAGSDAGAAAYLIGAILILIQTASEEVFFRGWLMRAVERRGGVAAAVALSAILFSGFHVIGGARSLITLVNLLLGGVWFALLALRSGGLVAPVLAHFGWNAAEEMGMGLIPNPGTSGFGAFVDWDLTGSPLWGGTVEGLNASIGMTCVLAALIVPLIWRPANAVAAHAPRPPGRAAG